MAYIMARCSTFTGLPLDTWAAIIGISPFEFNNCRYPAPKSAQCKDVIYQFPWQADHLSREEIGEAIADAERMLADELLYWPYPRYFTGEVQQYTRPHQRELFGFAGDSRGNWKTVQLNWKKIISGGVFNRTAIAAAPVITKLDEDGDGVYETFEAVVTDAAIATVSDPYELALYFVAANRHGESLDETWRVRPLTITISGNVATFRGSRPLLINPEIEFGVVVSQLDATDDANYVTALECWRVFTDDTATAALPYQGVAEWKTIPGCTQDCTFEVKELCLGEHNNDQGRVFASFGSASAWPFHDREPDRVNVNYVAGLPLIDGRIPNEMARIITYLSVSLLANEKCGCDRSNRILARWKERITRYEGNGADGSAAAFAYSNTPFPMTVGGQYAWSRVKRMRDIEVVSI
jgi:hypothetical protein